MDVRDKKDLIIAKIFLEMPQLESLYSNHLCRILSPFVIYKAISLMISLLSSASLILCVMTVKISAVALEG